MAYPTYYLDFHINTLWGISQQRGVPIIMTNEKKEIFISNSSLVQSLAKNAVALKSRSALRQAFKDGAYVMLPLFISNHDFYIHHVLQAEAKIQDFFFESCPLGKIELRSLVPFFKQMSHDRIVQIFTGGNINMAPVDEHFPQALEFLKTLPQGKDIIKIYLCKKAPGNDKEHLQAKVRNTMLEHFGSELDFFSDVTIINQYLHAQCPQTTIFHETKSAKGRCSITVNIPIVKDKYLSPSLHCSDYRWFLVQLLTALDGQKELWDIEKIKVFSPKSEGNALKFNLQSSTSLATFTTMVVDFFKHIQHHQVARNLESLDLPAKWLDQYRLHQRLPLQPSISVTRKAKL